MPVVYRESEEDFAVLGDTCVKSDENDVLSARSLIQQEV